ncbi:acyltransferase family protein [Actinokineospora cianjurensis]|uniref:Peptidoglycan/LPS O-acetylase OafA/YrhL n=1 Tax=Actinokineospora cianjurensis TaxID=585224 RepID=A0A421B730_9PSEU|nr:acyltransferase [Actinokineospora cianjurensis]RLK60099.1 peptidoglycan/LPS O-acetylase OafA/YrhL [Actinokineospora cianjurensis]
MRTLDHADFLDMRRFPALDGLRAFAAVIVIMFHFAGPKYLWLSGWTGVYVFFVLSGFLITTLLLREQDRTGRVSLKAFYLRRVFRILPPYLVILGGIVIFVYLRGEFRSRFMPEVLPYYLTFFNEFLPGVYPTAPDNFFSGSWTLGIEEKFYLFWPFLLVMAGAVGLAAAWRKLAFAVGALAVMIALVPITSGWLMHGSQKTLYISTIHYSILLIGCVLAVVMHHRRTYALVKPLTHPLAAIPVVAVFAVLHVNMEDLWWDTENNLALFLVYGVVVALLLVVLIAPGPMRWVLSTKPMRFVGERSYSLYLLQQPVHFVVVLTIPSLAQNRLITALVVVLVGLAIADLIHRWVEQPAINYGKRLIARRRAKRAEAAALDETQPIPVTKVATPA